MHSARYRVCDLRYLLLERGVLGQGALKAASKQSKREQILGNGVMQLAGDARPLSQSGVLGSELALVLSGGRQAGRHVVEVALQLTDLVGRHSVDRCVEGAGGNRLAGFGEARQTLA